MRRLPSWLALALGLGALAAPARALAQPVLGVDVSRYQGRVDYPKLKAAGRAYCFIKATQGKTYVDPRYASDLSEARAAGLAPGSYHFFVTGDAAPAQFQNFSAQVRLAPGDLPPVVDIEALSGEGPELVSELSALLELLEGHYQVTPILYSGLQFANEHLSGFERYPLWVAEYEVPEPRVPSGFAQWTFWQYSAHGRVDGIDDEVDLDRFFGTPEQFRALLFAAAPSAAPPAPPGSAPSPPTPSGSRVSPHFTPLPAASSAPSPSGPPPSVAGATPPSDARATPRWFWSTLLVLACLGFALWRVARRPRPQRVSAELPVEAPPPEPAEIAATEPPEAAATELAAITAAPAHEPALPTPFERWTRALASSAPGELEVRLDAIHALARAGRTTPGERARVVRALSRFVRDHVERASSAGPAAPPRPRPLAADLEMALCRVAELGGLVLPGADLHATQLEGAMLERAELSGANLSGANLQGASLRGARLFGASLQGAFLQGAGLDEASLGGAFLGGAFLAGASLAKSALQGALLQSANLPGADLRGANLSGAVAPGAHLPGARLSDADLSGASLHAANLQGASLESARLDQANLTGARLEGARLAGANVEAALGLAAPRAAHVAKASRALD